MRLFLLFSILACLNITQFIYAQSMPINWSNSAQIVYQSQDVSIELVPYTCQIPKEAIDQEEYGIRVVNHTNSPIELQFNLALQYGNKCYNCATESPISEFQRRIVIPAAASIQGSCQYPMDSNLSIFKQFNSIPNTAVLERVGAFDIQVKSLSASK